MYKGQGGAGAGGVGGDENGGIAGVFVGSDELREVDEVFGEWSVGEGSVVGCA